uniref:Exocyst complex component n=1 Tax=Amphora coffeiformis TaxID=265554 RepID=A0A7S3L0S2_9STRA
MAEEKNADRSSIEIKTLLRKLHPDRGSNHRDRVRALTKFRNYVLGGGGNSKKPEFYDDDIPLLLLGSAAPPQYIDPDDETLVGLYGLLQACGTPASDDSHGLKRSARPAMELTKQLLFDWKDETASKEPTGPKNVIANSFLSLPVKYYAHMQLHVHIRGEDTRAAAQEEACQTLVLLLEHHLAEDGEKPSPCMVDDVLHNPKAQQVFELWLPRHTTAAQRDKIKQNSTAREGEISVQQRQDALLKDDYFDDAGGGGGGGAADLDDVDHHEAEDESESSAAVDADDAIAVMRKRRKETAKEMKSMARDGAHQNHATAVRWEDSQLAREQAARAAMAGKTGKHETVRDSQEAAKEEFERQDERSKNLARDPLGIIQTPDFNLRDVDKSQAELFEQALLEIQEELQKAEAAGDEAQVAKIAQQKESLESLIDRMGGIEAMENAANLKYSVLPTSPLFDPRLFLTLVHRGADYNKLVGSLDRLSSKTENQVEQLQNLVRENFPLFVRCAEGYEEFRRTSQNIVGMGVNERVGKLEAVAETATFQARKSFKPLLDNTEEVRKVQSAMAVLNRISPILQTPALMRQHLENRRYSQALKTFRRVLVVDDTCRIELLNRVKAQAEDCVRQARHDLERRLAKDNVPEDDLLDGVRDLGELLELDVANKARKSGDHDEEGIFDIGGTVIKVRDHPPALACLLLQAAHFSQKVKVIVRTVMESSQRIFSGESMSKVQMADADTGAAEDLGFGTGQSPGKSSNNQQWKYDVLDARVLSTIEAVRLARIWLPRLVRVGEAAREDEKRKAARLGVKLKRSKNPTNEFLTPFEVFLTNVAPTMMSLLEHVAFCSLGSTTRSGGKEVTMTFGKNANDKLRAILRSPLPPAQSNKVGKEIADLVEIISQNSGGANSLRPESSTSMFQLSPLDECKTFAESAVITIEKRRCIYAFDVCARGGTNRASGSGKFDADALLNCLRNLSEQLSRPDQCDTEVEKGCELVVRRCCEGLASYVRDRGDNARLAAVSECADMISVKIKEVISAVAKLTNNHQAVEEIILEDVVGLESAMFEEYLENIRQTVSGSVRIGWLDQDAAPSKDESSQTFPSYLCASLLAIVRCRAQVEECLGDRVRHGMWLEFDCLLFSWLGLF